MELIINIENKSDTQYAINLYIKEHNRKLKSGILFEPWEGCDLVYNNARKEYDIIKDLDSLIDCDGLYTWIAGGNYSAINKKYQELTVQEA